MTWKISDVHMFARALSRRCGRYSTIGAFCNEWSPDFTESWSRSVHQPKNLTSRTRLRTASSRRRTRPLITSLMGYPFRLKRSHYILSYRDWYVFCSPISTYYDKKYRQNHAEGLVNYYRYMHYAYNMHVYRQHGCKSIINQDMLLFEINLANYKWQGYIAVMTCISHIFYIYY